MLLFYTALIDAEEDRLTFEHIYQEYPKQMYQVANDILKNHQAAEDAVQEAFLGIAKSIHSVPTRSESAIKAYVLTVARNAALTALTAEQKWNSHICIEKLPLRSKEDLFDEISNLEDYKKLLGLIEKLPLQYREVLMLRYVMDLKPREIAATLNRKTTTVQQQISRGKKLLAALYEREVAQNDEE